VFIARHDFSVVLRVALNDGLKWKSMYKNITICIKVCIKIYNMYKSMYKNMA
jgi:hypothetical protein